MSVSKFFSEAKPLLGAPTNILWTTAVAGITSAMVSAILRRREIRFNLQAEYTQEQTKLLKATIGKYHGRMLQAMVSFDHRMMNLYRRDDASWLQLHGEWASAGYYFKSFVHRFMLVHALVRQFEQEAIVIDGRIARAEDYAFLSYIDAMRWVASAVALFDGLDYDASAGHDHFYYDNMRVWCDELSESQRLMNMDALWAATTANAALTPVLQFFDGVSRDEKRLRWDRLVAMHIICLGFEWRFGHPSQRPARQTVVDVCQQFRNPVVGENLVTWMAKHGLKKEQVFKWLSERACGEQGV